VEDIVDAKGKQKRKPTLVHQAIRKTLHDRPDEFSILNGGMVIVARGATVDDKERLMHLDRMDLRHKANSNAISRISLITRRSSLASSSK